MTDIAKSGVVQTKFLIAIFSVRIDCVMLIPHTCLIHVYLKIAGTKIKTLKNKGLKRVR